jgi:hypothetical protein
MKPVDLNEIYRRIPPEEIPWNMEEPPQPLVELIEISGKYDPHLGIYAFMEKK